ncbi:MAG: hypothetical protein KGN35_05025, partial [Betaproteobacteria bacterium]|nr:hypothetical protein [Betaproteobacteria bacterium]
QAGFYLLLGKDGSKGTRTMFSNLAYAKKVDGINIDSAHINATLRYLLDLSKVVPVTWFTPRIEHHINPRLLLKNGCNFTYSLRPNLANTFLVLEAEIDKAIRKLGSGNISVVSQNAVFGFDFSVDLLNCKEVFWSDGDHFSETGEVRFGMRLPDNFLDFKN